MIYFVKLKHKNKEEMSEADTAAATQAPTTEEQKHDVEYASEETKNAVSIKHT